MILRLKPGCLLLLHLSIHLAPKGSMSQFPLLISNLGHSYFLLNLLIKKKGLILWLLLLKSNTVLLSFTFFNYKASVGFSQLFTSLFFFGNIFLYDEV